MSKKDQYKLSFNKTKCSTGIIFCCNQVSITNESYYLSDILNQLSNVEPQYLLDEINNAMAGKYYEEFYSVDGSLFNDGVQINPPNAIINNTFEVSLTDLKGLLEEWILFCNT